MVLNRYFLVLYWGIVKVGLGISRTNADSQWNPVSLQRISSKFLVVETKRFVGSFLNVILTRQSCGQRSSRSAESKRRSIGKYFCKRVCYMFYTYTRYVRVHGCVFYDAAIDTNIPLSLAESAHALACTLSPPVNVCMRTTYTAMQRHRHRLTNKNSSMYS